MTTDGTRFEDTVRDAIEAHAASLDSTVPDFDALMNGRHRTARRTLAAATLLVAVVGIGGVVLASNRSTGTSSTTPDARASATTVLAAPGVTSVPRTEPAEFFCTDPLGEDPLGRQLFGACEPEAGSAAGDYACVGRKRTDRGIVVFSSCEPVGQLGPLPGSDGDEPFDNPDDLPVRPTTYVVQYADIPSAVAAEHCVSVNDLATTNGWADAWSEFPVVGTEILVPLGFDESSCDLRSYTITEGDSSRIGVAEKFCVSVQALDTANLDTDGYDIFFPGLTIVVPPTSDRVC